MHLQRARVMLRPDAVILGSFAKGQTPPGLSAWQACPPRVTSLISENVAAGRNRTRQPIFSNEKGRLAVHASMGTACRQGALSAQRISPLAQRLAMVLEEQMSLSNHARLRGQFLRERTARGIRP